MINRKIFCKLGPWLKRHQSSYASSPTLMPHKQTNKQTIIYWYSNMHCCRTHEIYWPVVLATVEDWVVVSCGQYSRLVKRGCTIGWDWICIGTSFYNQQMILTLDQKLASDEVLVWLSVWSEVQIVCVSSSWCQCIPNPIIFCLI